MTNTELVILGLVAERPKHGYQLELDIDQRGMREWTEIGFSSIYYILNKLETSGWLASEKEDAGDRPARKVYHLTPQGTVALHQAILDRAAAPRPHTSDFDLTLANLGQLEPSEVVTALRARQKNLITQIAHVKNKAQIDHETGIPWFVDALFNHSQAMLQAELDWLNALLSRLPANRYPTPPSKP
jgi:DNA-binding PadR family transcriptional regulator